MLINRPLTTSPSTSPTARNRENYLIGLSLFYNYTGLTPILDPLIILPIIVAPALNLL